MGIFRRKKAEDQELQRDAEELDGVDAAEAESDVEGDSDPQETDESTDAETSDEADGVEESTRLPRPYDLDRSSGPYDRSEIEDGSENRLDLGGLVLTPFAGSELRLDVDDSGENITGVTAVADESAVQLQAFAAPKSSGLWDDIRDEIADNLIAAGGTAEEKMGELGIELHARMPAKGENGRTTYSPVRFVGVDGPRWFLRGVLSGKAAVDDGAAAPLFDFVRATIVVRGAEARAPRELLELAIPSELLEQAPQPIEPVEQDAEEQPANAEDFKPFERGPEITEVR